MADRASIAITVLLALTVVGTGGLVMQNIEMPSQAELTENRQAFEQYCTQVYGSDATVYRANDAHNAEHNGLHCDSTEGMIHLTQVPPDVWEQYKNGEVSASYVTENLESPPGLLGLPSNWRDLLGVAVAIGAAAVIIGFLRRAHSGRQEPAK